jgi:xylulokinase
MRVLTLDLGIGALKACLWEDGKTIVCHSAPLSTHRDGCVAEQSPLEWWEQTVRLVSRISNRYSDATGVDVVGVTGHMHSLTPTSEAGEALGNVAIVQDRRALGACSELEQEFGIQRILQWTGGRLDPTSALAKARHFHRTDDFHWRKAHWLLSPKDFLRMRLTGEAATDPMDAAGSMLWDIGRQEWHPELAKFVGLSSDRLPPVRPTTSLAGRLTHDAALQLGLRSGTPVAMGGGDDIEAFGAGALSPGDVFEHLGTTGSIYIATERPYFDQEGRVETYPDVTAGRWLVGGSTNAAGMAQKWALDVLGLSEDWDAADRLFERMATVGKPSTITFLPYLAGERAPLWNIDRTGALLGLRTEHGAEDVLQAVVEGVLFSLRAILDVLSDLCGSISLGPVLTAGPFGMQETLGQVRADIYGREVVRIGQPDTTGFAAMVLAVSALTNEEPYALAKCLLKQRWLCAPRTSAAAYDQGYQRYLNASRILDVFDRQGRDAQ